MHKWLSLAYISTNSYPIPDESINITISGWLLWKQWIFWDTVMKATEKLSSVPVDPLIGNPYTYSVLHGWSKFQISSIIEWWLFGFSNDNNLLETKKTYASSSSIAYVSWDYISNIITAKNGGNCITLTIPSLIINNIPVGWNLSSTWSYNFVYSGLSNIPKSYIDFMDSIPSDKLFEIKEVLNKCNISNVDELNLYFTNLAITFQQFIWVEPLNDLIYRYNSVRVKGALIKQLESNGINISDTIIDQVYNDPSYHIFSDSFTWDNNTELVWTHNADTIWKWEYLSETPSNWAYIISGNKLRKTNSFPWKISPVPPLTISSPNTIHSFEVVDFNGWSINVYSRYTDDNNYYWLTITPTWYQVISKVLWVETTSNITEAIPNNSFINFFVNGNNIILKINNIEKENIIDGWLTEIWKHAIELNVINTIIDNYKFEYK